jgi:hypothetical protein
MGSNANEKKHRKHNMPRDFPDVVDWSAIPIDLWEAPGWLMSELGHSRRFCDVRDVSAWGLIPEMPVSDFAVEGIGLGMIQMPKPC